MCPFSTNTCTKVPRKHGCYPSKGNQYIHVNDNTLHRVGTINVHPANVLELSPCLFLLLLVVHLLVQSHPQLQEKALLY